VKEKDMKNGLATYNIPLNVDMRRENVGCRLSLLLFLQQ
jgi:hypothetical protein